MRPRSMPTGRSRWWISPAQIQAWSGGGLYHHRIKPAVVLDALSRFAAPVCFVDSDSIIRPGFHAEVPAKMAPQEVWSVDQDARW